MANEFSELAEIRDYIGDTCIVVKLVHREDGGKGYTMQVFEPTEVKNWILLDEVQTKCIRPHV